MSTAPAAPAKSSESKQESVFLISYPKVIFLWPTLVVAFVASLYMWLVKGQFAANGVPSTGAVIVADIFPDGLGFRPRA